MITMLEDMGKDLSDCEVECVVELGRVLQSDYVISGTIGKIENMFLLTLTVHDTHTGSLMGQKTLRNTDKFVLLDQTGPETKALVKDVLSTQVRENDVKPVQEAESRPLFVVLEVRGVSQEKEVLSQISDELRSEWFSEGKQVFTKDNLGSMLQDMGNQ